MPKCYRCGKWGLFLNVVDGYCADCLPKILADAAAKKKRLAPSTPVDEYHPPVQYNVTKLYLDRLPERNVYHDAIIDGQSALYSYPRLQVRDVNQNVLKYMCENRKYRVTPTIYPDGSIALMYDGALVAFLCERERMCKDWIKRGDMIYCEFVCFRSGFERVAITFYRNEYARLSNHKSTVIKLTRYSSDEKQDSICCLTDGEKLTCCEDDDSDRICVCDLRNNEIGCLPSKYEDQYDDFAGIFFDHSELSEDGDKEIPYVRIYF